MANAPTKSQQAEYDAFKQLADEAANRRLGLLYAGPAKYAPMDESKPGEWRTILSGGIPVALAWTDNENAFDIIMLRSSPVLQELREYVSNAKECGVPAGWAFQTLDNRIKRFDSDESVTLGPVETGDLSGVWATADRYGSRRGTMSSTSVNDTENEDVPEV